MLSNYKVPQQQVGIVVLECLVSWGYAGGWRSMIVKTAGKCRNSQGTALILFVFLSPIAPPLLGHQLFPVTEVPS